MAVSRDNLLQAAAVFLGRQPAATMDEIAVATGVSRATLHRHFAGRAALIEALTVLAVAGMESALDGARLTEDSATDALERLVRACEPVADYLVLMYVQYQNLDLPQALEGFSDVEHRITDLFARGQKSGEFRTDLTAVWLTEVFFSMVAGAAWAIQTGRVARRDFPHMIASLMLHGVSTP
ncbi:TetR/AcrR family transcriptional regulator [Mycobacteroides salmoniphilum]|uniref:TetR/AcrR family transcriptional regulator n=1 Tax=Mycobacteroides salmoniphilum TaxID=404941 RepID=UPI001066422D|nr:TetR/AcrR family transcriptional regulator [Mycobacteroides salmoniphilum]TDZ76817.1 Bacterial regulatory protein, tetR family [Mycobacteroides salmoniphilum]TDZ86977.1 Bacterial regulatory protein, tetR family [Mycobacteroides salmoniphilum]